MAVVSGVRRGAGLWPLTVDSAVSGGPAMKRRLLLVSNSTLHGSGYLHHCRHHIAQFFGK